jgi:hypothetical protein
MSDQKISQLTAVTQANVVPATDVMPIVNGGATKKVTPTAATLSALANATATAIGGGSAYTPTKLLELVANNTGGGENNTLRFRDTDTTTATNQFVAKIEGYTDDATNPGLAGYIGIRSEGSSGAVSYVIATGNATTISEKVEVRSDGDMRVYVGNLVIGTSGKGIDFSATSGTGTSELLADYEEGTWTPTDGSGAGLTFSTATGTYTRIGRSVTLQFVVTYPVTASAAATKISGVPFTSLNQCVGPCINNKINAALLIGTGGTGINLYDLNGLNNYSNVSFSNGTIIGTITYFV